MPRGKKGAGKRLRGQRGNTYTQPEREACYQLYLVTGNKNEVARQLDMDKNTVSRIVNDFKLELTPEEQKARQTAVSEQLASRFYKTSAQLLDSITPEDMESGRLPTYRYDKDGAIMMGPDGKPVILSYTYFGPKLTEKAIASGIFTDKIKVLRDLERASAQDQQNGALLLPEGVQQLLAAVQGKIASIEVLKMNFRQENPELSSRLDAAMQAAVVNAEDVTTKPAELDFDNA